VSAAATKGLDAWQRRLASAGRTDVVKAALQGEAEFLAAEARAAAPGALASAIGIADESHGTKLAFRIGTADPLGRVLEFGTLRRPAAPWLLPALRGRVRRIKATLQKASTVAGTGRS
jgi:hypothetical protein